MHTVNVAYNQNVFDRPLDHRLAFREFGTVLGIKSNTERPELKGLATKIMTSWEGVGAVPIPKSTVLIPADLKAITLVMYATALYPGGEFCQFTSCVPILGR
jgi:hypothetical protein